jgi:hypothetical protein
MNPPGSFDGRRHAGEVLQGHRHPEQQDVRDAFDEANDAQATDGGSQQISTPTGKLQVRSQSSRRLIGDRAYDSDPLDRELAAEGIEIIAPHKVESREALRRKTRVKPATQDGRALRRYRRREVERLNAWLQNFRRIAMSFDYYAEH